MSIKAKKSKLKQSEREVAVVERDGVLIYWAGDAKESDVTINNNGRFKDESGNKIYCRHLAYAWLSYHKRKVINPDAPDKGEITNINGYHQLFATESGMRSIACLAENKLDKTKLLGRAKSYRFSHFSEGDIGRLLALIVTNMPVGEAAHCLLITDNHALAIEVMRKSDPDRFIVKFYDPNLTLIHRRAICRGLAALKTLSLYEFISLDRLKLYTPKTIGLTLEDYSLDDQDYCRSGSHAQLSLISDKGGSYSCDTFRVAITTLTEIEDAKKLFRIIDYMLAANLSDEFKLQALQVSAGDFVVLRKWFNDGEEPHGLTLIKKIVNAELKSESKHAMLSALRFRDLVLSINSGFNKKRQQFANDCLEGILKSNMAADDKFKIIYGDKTTEKTILPVVSGICKLNVESFYGVLDVLLSCKIHADQRLAIWSGLELQKTYSFSFDEKDNKEKFSLVIVSKVLESDVSLQEKMNLLACAPNLVVAALSRLESKDAKMLVERFVDRVLAPLLSTESNPLDNSDSCQHLYDVMSYFKQKKSKRVAEHVDQLVHNLLSSHLSSAMITTVLVDINAKGCLLEQLVRRNQTASLRHVLHHMLLSSKKNDVLINFLKDSIFEAIPLMYLVFLTGHKQSISPLRGILQMLLSAESLSEIDKLTILEKVTIVPESANATNKNGYKTLLAQEILASPLSYKSKIEYIYKLAGRSGSGEVLGPVISSPYVTIEGELAVFLTDVAQKLLKCSDLSTACSMLECFVQDARAENEMFRGHLLFEPVSAVLINELTYAMNEQLPKAHSVLDLVCRFGDCLKRMQLMNNDMPKFIKQLQSVPFSSSEPSKLVSPVETVPTYFA